MCILLLLDGLSYECQLDKINWYCCSSQLCPYWFSACPIYQFLENKKGVEVINRNSGFVYFSLQFCQFLPEIFWCCIVRCIHIKDCHPLVDNWPLYHMHVHSLSLITFFEVCFVYNNSYSSFLFYLMLPCYTFSIGIFIFKVGFLYIAYNWKLFTFFLFLSTLTISVF